ncbi:MAG: hypothetical protein RR005_03885 [Mucinivorans sp.]
MTPEEFALLKQSGHMLEEYINQEPAQVALQTGIAPLASWIKTLQKCRTKLPEYYAARCIVPQISYEQCTSQAVAMSREFGGGALAVDLTCGLGVDSWALSKSFKKVLAVEIDPLRAAIARHNFELLGVDNIEVVVECAEDFVAKFRGKADFIFIDPARRDGKGQKIYSPQQSSPNVVELLPRLKEISKRIVIKLSPLFDVAECWHIFGQEIAVEVVSQKGECREVVVHIGSESPKTITNTIVGGDNGVQRLTYPYNTEPPTAPIDVERNYLSLPDVAFYKSRTISWLIKGENAIYDNYIFSSQALTGLPLRCFKINQVMNYKPKELKKVLRSQGVTSATIYMRGTRYSMERVRKELALKEGTEATFFLTRDSVYFVTL